MKENKFPIKPTDTPDPSAASTHPLVPLYFRRYQCCLSICVHLIYFILCVNCAVFVVCVCVIYVDGRGSVSEGH